jgi:predicted  nucleic acid-binding Zn-ribbon protein
MSETTPMVTTDLDRLSERVEKAAAMVQQLRDDRTRLERERDDLARRLRETEQKLQGQDVAAVLSEVASLRREQREWTSERREVATRIEALVRKLEKLDG